MRRDVYHSIVPADTACTLPRMHAAGGAGADRRRLMVWLAWLRTHPVCVQKLSRMRCNHT